ncbi:MAG: radical SAM protein [Saprospiraceae bacterium]
MRVFLLTPPFTQPNTSYPATQYLTGFLNSISVESHQSDLSLDVLLAIFKRDTLALIFEEVEERDIEMDDNCFDIFNQRDLYLRWVDSIILFLQGKNQTLCYRIVNEGSLPKAGRFQNAYLFSTSFGVLSVQDKAKYLATLFIEDLADFIQGTIEPFFGFSRYAERLGRAATSFDDLYTNVTNHNSLVTSKMEEILTSYIERDKYDVVAITIPFLGNVFAAFRCGFYIKRAFPNIKIVMGGGYCNTELREVYDSRVFECTDFICLDDGELPLKCILNYIKNGGKGPLKRTFVLINSGVAYKNDCIEKDIPQSEVGTPSYLGLHLDHYLQLLDIANPMQRLWSDGRWNKLTLAHGCYWGKCTFCDVTLDYIQRYEPIQSKVLVDRILQLVAETKSTGFHFVDEAAPPKLLKELALELIKRQVLITWWTNIRFEAKFDEDLCQLLKLSGCIAVSGGLEVASDRLLALIEKGVTVAQVAQVCHSFKKAGIMVHAYLMYGFPTQTEQETIDSLEMVRQFINHGLIQSAFWHQFAMTAHSPVGKAPEKYQVSVIGPEFKGFAFNDVEHYDKIGDHSKYSNGLASSMFNFMQGIGLDSELQYWFDFKIPKTIIPKDYIENVISTPQIKQIKSNSFVSYFGQKPIECIVDEENDIFELQFLTKDDLNYADFPMKYMSWILNLMDSLDLYSFQNWNGLELIASFSKWVENETFDDFQLTSSWKKLKEIGLLVV